MPQVHHINQYKHVHGCLRVEPGGKLHLSMKYMCSWSKAHKYSRGSVTAQPLDDEAARQARLDAGIAAEALSGSSHLSSDTVDTSLADTPSRKRGPQDSGKGVRLMVRFFSLDVTRWCPRQCSSISMIGHHCTQSMSAWPAFIA